MPHTILEVTSEGERGGGGQEKAVGLLPSRDQPWGSAGLLSGMHRGNA